MKTSFLISAAVCLVFCSCGSDKNTAKQNAEQKQDTLAERDTAPPIPKTEVLDGNLSDFYVPPLDDGIILCISRTLPYYVSCEEEKTDTVIFYENGQLRASGKHKGGKKTGLWTSYFPLEKGKMTAQVSAKGRFKNDFPVGKWVFYYSNGKKKAEGSFAPGKFELGCAGSGNFIDISIQTGKWEYWYENGIKSVSCAFRADKYKLEKLNGIYTEWHSNGNKKKEGFLRDGEKNKKWTWWHENGKKSMEGFYEYKDCGLYDYTSYECPAGTWTHWNEDGGVEKTEEYIDGKIKE